MARAKQTGDRYADKGRRSTGSASVASEAVRGAGSEVLLAPTGREAGASAALEGLATYDEGWTRIVSHEFGNLVYLKFKFSKGKYAGGYVFYRFTDHDWPAALFGLLFKVESVYAGALRPTPDTPYE